jgi:hypothetical protein
VLEHTDPTESEDPVRQSGRNEFKLRVSANVMQSQMTNGDYYIPNFELSNIKGKRSNTGNYSKAFFDDLSIINNFSLNTNSLKKKDTLNQENKFVFSTKLISKKTSNESLKNIEAKTSLVIESRKQRQHITK